jgi:hypothetical protein
MAKSGSTAESVMIELPPERALFEGVADAWICALSASERPSRGLAGMLDWLLKGQISRALAAGIFSGAPGECAYLPVSHQGKTLHLLLAGMGSTSRTRTLPASTLDALESNLEKLGRNAWGVSQQDLGEESIRRISRALAAGQSEARLWISP